jgi:cytoskeletal protein RodZ
MRLSELHGRVCVLGINTDAKGYIMSNKEILTGWQDPRWDESTVTELSLGEILRRCREANNVSLDEVVKRLNLRADIVTALENDDTSWPAPPVYRQGYYRAYMKLFNLDERYMKNMVKKEVLSPSSAVTPTINKSEEGWLQRCKTMAQKFQYGSRIKLIIGGCVILTILALIYWF